MVPLSTFSRRKRLLHMTLSKQKLMNYTILTSGGRPLVHYSLKEVSGKVIENRESEAARIPLLESILGFQKGVVGMLPGEEREIYLHPDAYLGGHLTATPHVLLILNVTVISH